MSKAVMSAYEKMLADPIKSRVDTVEIETPHGGTNPTLKQPANSGGFEVVSSSDPDAQMIAEIDRRIAEKKKLGIVNEKATTQPLNEVEKINKRLDSIEETLIEMMRVQKKLMRKL